MVLVTVVGAAVAAVGFADLMLPWLTVMALAAPGLVAVCVVHAVRHAPLHTGYRRAGLYSWGAGFACGTMLHLAGSALALPAAAAVPAVAYWAFGPRGQRNPVDANAGG
jgi:hypothetical protein